MNFVYVLLLVPVVLSAPVDDYVVQFRSVLTSYMSDTQTKNSAGVTIDDYIKRVGAPTLSEYASKVLTKLDQNNAKYTAAGISELNRRGTLFLDAKALTTSTIVKDMTVAMMKRSNQKEWTCTCTYLSQVFTGMKASMDANCKKTA
ncbi:hypothetical protein Q1695_011719 [Nippostrongylus brasiliensis]|nr:hypothetical protein Q1695_011719 [Nippostrongylus brasiliensis]